MTKKMVALVATAVMVAGERTVIQPGEELPNLSSHDEKELLKSGAAKDDSAKSQVERDAAKAEKAGQAEFQAARNAVMAQQSSIDSAASGEAEGKAAARSKAK